MKEFVPEKSEKSFWKNVRKLFEKKNFILFLSFLVPFLLLFLLRMRCSAIHGGEPGTDGFYHAAMALKGWDFFSAGKFPFLSLSIWHDSFADKELLYHTILQGIFFLQKLFTDSTSFPFTIPSMTFAGISLFVFLFLLQRLKISFKILFLAGILFSFGCFAFTYRFLMLRPHVFSIAFLLGIFLIFCMKKGIYQKVFLFLFSFLYSWSYSNPHFLLLALFPYLYFTGKELLWKEKIFIFLCVTGGLLAGYILHPQFPNTFLIWKVQGLDAMLNPIFYGRKFAPKLTPMEMMPGNFAWFRNAFPFYFLFYLSLFLFVRLWEKRKKTALPESFSPCEKSIFFLAFFFTAGTLFALRAIEYAFPFLVASFAILLENSQKEKTGFFKWKMPEIRVYTLLYLLVSLFLCFNIFLMLKSNFKNTPPDALAAFLKKNTPENSLVINLDWGDFPAMFYANGHNKLLWGMDPAFSYAFAPRKARQLENCVLRSIREGGMDERIRLLTGADYAFVLARREKFIQYLKECSWKVVYESKEGCVFALNKERKHE